MNYSALQSTTFTFKGGESEPLTRHAPTEAGLWVRLVLAVPVAVEKALDKWDRYGLTNKRHIQQANEGKIFKNKINLNNLQDFQATQQPLYIVICLFHLKSNLYIR